MHIDAFGNLITNLPAKLLRGNKEGMLDTLQHKHHTARVVSSYAAGRPNEVVGIVGSSGFAELAIRNANAARVLDASRGDSVRLVVRKGPPRARK